MFVVFLLEFYGVSMGALVFWWDCYGIPLWFSLCFFWYFSRLLLGIPSISPGVPIGIPLDFHKVSMEPLWHFYGIPMGLFLVFYWIFMFLLGFYATSKGFLLDSCGISMICLWYFYRIAMGFIWYVHGGSLLFWWDSYGIPLGFP